MTLNDIITSALAQLDRGHDAQTLDVWRGKFTGFANDGQYDLANSLKLRRTDTVTVTDGEATLPRECIKFIEVVQGNKRYSRIKDCPDGEAEITYRYSPKKMANTTDQPDIPEHMHGLIVTYVVARERASGDVTTQRGANIYMQLYEAGKTSLRPNRDEYSIINRW